MPDVNFLLRNGPLTGSFLSYFSRESEDEGKPAYRRMMSMYVGSNDSRNSHLLRSSWNGSAGGKKDSLSDDTIVHPGALSVMLRLIPAVQQSAGSEVLMVYCRERLPATAVL